MREDKKLQSALERYKSEVWKVKCSMRCFFVFGSI